jgi:ABC-type phosphate transport system auxiliary subunit
MNVDKVQAYIDQQVQRLADNRVKPIMDSINAELTAKRHNDAQKAELDKRNAECDQRITALQAELGKANQEVNDLAVKLAEATVGAANTGTTSPTA